MATLKDSPVVDQRFPVIKIALEKHGAIAGLQTNHSYMVYGFGRTVADAITDLMCKLGLWSREFSRCENEVLRPYLPKGRN